MDPGDQPQTLAYALTDSPAGLAGWIAEKFREWSDCGGDIETRLAKDWMLADIIVLVDRGDRIVVLAVLRRPHGSAILPAGDKISVPTGYAQFPREMLKAPRRAAERVFTDIRRWSVMPKGGHFAALEQPELLAGEVQAFFRVFAVTALSQSFRGASSA